MRSKAIILAVVSFLVSVSAFGQEQSQTRPAEAPATDTIAKDIPGVIKGGTRIQVVIASVPGHGAPGVVVQGTEGPIALPDGNMIFCETVLGRVARVDKDGNESVFVDAAVANAPNGLAWDHTGRLVGATTAPGHLGVQVIYPKRRSLITSRASPLFDPTISLSTRKAASISLIRPTYRIHLRRRRSTTARRIASK
jgi:hypothetical protein